MTRLIFSFLFIFSYSFLLGNSIQVSLPIKNLMENEIGQLHIISENELHVERGDKIQGNGFTLTFFASAQSGRDHFIYAYNIETSRTGDFRTPTMEVKTRNGSAKLPSAPTIRLPLLTRNLSI